MKKLIEAWPYELWPLEALGGLVMVAMLVYAIVMIIDSVDDGIKRAGYEHTPTSDAEPGPKPKAL
jgi:hypothetical protein